MINCEEDRTLRAVLVGMLQEAERRARGIESQRRVKRRTSFRLALSALLGVDDDSSSLPITGQSSG
jgi:hypothetical protein